MISCGNLIGMRAMVRLLFACGTSIRVNFSLYTPLTNTRMSSGYSTDSEGTYICVTSSPVVNWHIKEAQLLFIIRAKSINQKPAVVIP